MKREPVSFQTIPFLLPLYRECICTRIKAQMLHYLFFKKKSVFSASINNVDEKYYAGCSCSLGAPNIWKNGLSIAIHPSMSSPPKTLELATHGPRSWVSDHDHQHRCLTRSHLSGRGSMGIMGSPALKATWESATPEGLVSSPQCPATFLRWNHCPLSPWGHPPFYKDSLNTFAG